MARFKRKVSCCYVLGSLFLFAVTDIVTCYEKTLRKIVRTKSKMVQRPFDDMSGIMATSDGMDLNPLNLHNQHWPARSASLRTLFHRTVRPMVSLVSSSMDIGRGKIYSRIKAQAEKLRPIELRSARNIFFNTSKAGKHKFDLFFFEQDIRKGNRTTWENVQGIKRIPFSIFPPDENELQNIEVKTHKQLRESIIIPNPENLAGHKANDTHTKDNLFVKGIFRPKLAHSAKPRIQHEEHTEPNHPEVETQKFDYYIEVATTNAPDYGSYNMSIEGSQICAMIKTAKTNIDAQKRFPEFDIEPPWMTKKHFWNNIFNSRYEYLMRNSKWPPLKVILIPRTHIDTIWKNTFEHNNNNSANKMLSNLVKKMNFYSNLTFAWNEISHLSQWWTTTTQKSRVIFRKLLKGGRLEITTGGWVESDEATTHIFGLVHILIEGHQWLANNLGYTPEVAWLTNSVTHSPTMVYLLSLSGITKLIFTNVHYSWEEYFAEYQISDFVWVQNWISEGFPSSELNKLFKRIGKDRYPSNSVISHYLQFNSDGFEACGPNSRLCTTEFNFIQQTKLMDIHGYNIKEKSELLLEQYSKAGTLSPHNIIIAPIGGPRHFAYQSEFDYQYNNYQKIAEFINVNRDIYKATIEFGTPIDYFNSMFKKSSDLPSLKGDFLNFADVENGSPAYWTGFFTSRPLLKILLRRLQSTLRSTEILFSFAVTRSVIENRGVDVANIIGLLTKSRETVARLLDRNVVSGTLSANALRYVHKKILLTAKDCWLIQEIIISLLGTNKKRKKPYVRKYVYRHGEFISLFRTVNPGDHLLVFNSLTHERHEIVELFTKSPNIRIIDHNRKDVTIQVNPVWKYNSKNVIVISKRFFKVTFVVLIPPLTIELFKIKETYATMHNIATIFCMKCIVEEYMNDTYFPFNIHPIEKGDIQIESYKHRLIFDESSGFLKAVIEKDSNTEKVLMIDYGAFTSSYINSGIFLFNTNMSKPVRDILLPYRTGLKSKSLIIISGQLTTELTSIYGRLLQHTVKIFNLMNSPLSSAIYIETKIDLDVSPNNRDIELFMSIQTDISNGNSPEIYTDNNGYQYTSRTLNVSRRIESNVYPMTTLSFIQDRKRRMTVLTDHAQGVTALQEGQLVLMLDRRVLFDDGRGTEEGLADSGSSCQRHYILLENFVQTARRYDDAFPSRKTVVLPSFRANYLSNTLNYDSDLFIIDKNDTANCMFAYIPLIKAPFPCDVALINYRAILDGMTVKPSSTTVSLMILHRQSFTCLINYEALVHCDVDPKFSIENILPSMRSVFKTNLAGTNKGTRLRNINIDNFSPMELLTLRMHF